MAYIFQNGDKLYHKEFQRKCIFLEYENPIWIFDDDASWVLLEKSFLKKEKEVLVWNKNLRYRLK